MAKQIREVSNSNPEKIFIQAEAFQRLAKAGHMSALKPRLGGNPLFGEYVSFAAFTNQAFACEIYLKCISVIEKSKYLFTHNLLILFNDLDQSSRDYLIKRNDIDTKYNDTLLSMMPRNQKRTLIEMLTEAQDYFPNMRYLFEGNKYADFDLGFAIGFMRERILKLKPELEEITRIQ